MTEQRRTALRELQDLDVRIKEARERIQDFDPLFEEIEEPALVLESELGTTRKRVQEMKLEERRLELSIDEKRERLKRLEERLGNVRNLREEAAVSAELEMVKRALQNDEQEAYTLLDQIRRSDERLEELEGAYEEARKMVEPKKEELLEERSEAQASLKALESERERFAGDMDPGELKTYEAIRGQNARVAVAELTEDGACGHCFGIVPLQTQNEIRHGATLIRCEACGVILAAPAPATEKDADGESGPGEVEAEAAVSDEVSEDVAEGAEDTDEALVEE